MAIINPSPHRPSCSCCSSDFFFYEKHWLAGVRPRCHNAGDLISQHGGDGLRLALEIAPNDPIGREPNLRHPLKAARGRFDLAQLFEQHGFPLLENYMDVDYHIQNIEIGTY